MNKTNIIFIISSVLAVVTLAGYLMFANIIDNKRDTLVTTTKEVYIANDKYKKIMTQNQLLENPEVSEEDLIDSYFLSEDEIVPFIESIEGFDVYTGTDTSIRRIDEIVDTTTARKSLEMELVSTGDFESLRTLVKLLENMPVEVSFEEVQIVEETKETEEGGAYITWSLKSIFVIHTYKE